MFFYPPSSTISPYSAAHNMFCFDFLETTDLRPGEENKPHDCKIQRAKDQKCKFKTAMRPNNRYDPEGEKEMEERKNRDFLTDPSVQFNTHIDTQRPIVSLRFGLCRTRISTVWKQKLWEKHCSSTKDEILYLQNGSQKTESTPYQ